MLPPSICIEYMLRTLVPPNAVAMPNRASPVRAGPPPGNSCARPTKPRLSTGNSASCSWSTTPERSDFVVSTPITVALTSTVSERVPTESPILTSATSPTVMTIRRSSVPKPDSSALTRYGPGCRAGARNAPWSSVTSDLVMPVPSFWIVTVTPGSTPPVLSVTVPRTSAVWACTSDGAASTAANSAPATESLRRARVAVVGPMSSLLRTKDVVRRMHACRCRGARTRRPEFPCGEGWILPMGRRVRCNSLYRPGCR